MDVTEGGLGCWPLLARDPALRRHFGGYMRGQLEYRLDWTEAYDVVSGLLVDDEGFSRVPPGPAEGVQEDAPTNAGTSPTGSGSNKEKRKNNKTLLVDVGGSHGHDLVRLLARVPDLPAGCLVLQDLPDVLADAGELDERIVKMPYDFFEPQPVVGES